MGFAVSRFSTFVQIAYGWGSAEAFSRVRLYAIVVHDPQDIMFTYHLYHKMEDLNVKTGEHFAFFAMTPPPPDWGGRPNPSSRFDLLNTCASSFRTSEEYEQQLITAFLRRINLSGVALPVVILTNDLKADSFIYFDTSIDTLESQLIELGNFCSKQQNQFSLREPVFLDCLEEITNGNYNNRKAGGGLLKALQDITAPEDLKEGWLNEMESVNTISKRIKTLQRTINRLETLGKENNDRLMELIQYVTLLTLCYNEIAHKPHYNANEFLITKEELLHAGILRRSETWNNCETYNNFVSNVDLASYNPLRLGQEIISVNWSKHVALPLIESVEEEANASVVQQMRKEMGVPMPEYYRRFCGKNKSYYKVETNYGEINLNGYNKLRIGNLYVISLGNIIIAWDIMHQDGYLSSLNPLRKDYTEVFNDFNSLRDTHAGRTEFTNAYQLLYDSNKLFKDYLSNIQPTLSKLAQNLQSNRTEQCNSPSEENDFLLNASV